MSKRNNEILSEYVIKQFPVRIFKEIIIVYLDLIETFKLMLHDGVHNLKLNSNFEVPIKSNRYNISKVESLTIQKHKDSEAMKKGFKYIRISL